MSHPIRLLVHGATGRMGRSVLRLAAGDPRFAVVAAVSRGGDGVEGVAGLAAARLAEAPAFQVAIDFSLADAFDPILALCRARGAAFASGTTGLSAGQQQRLADAATDIPVLLAANFSLGVAVLEDLVRRAAAALPEWAVSIVETHHVHKQDAPSGTALSLARAAAEGGGQEAAIESRRQGEVVGEHRLRLAGPGELLELAHVAGDRELFARGALLAASRLDGRAAGAYRLAQLLFGDDR